VLVQSPVGKQKMFSKLVVIQMLF
jgi:hypothetical protein